MRVTPFTESLSPTSRGTNRSSGKPHSRRYLRTPIKDIPVSSYLLHRQAVWTCYSETLSINSNQRTPRYWKLRLVGMSVHISDSAVPSGSHIINGVFAVTALPRVWTTDVTWHAKGSQFRTYQCEFVELPHLHEPTRRSDTRVYPADAIDLWASDPSQSSMLTSLSHLELTTPSPPKTYANAYLNVSISVKRPSHTSELL